MALFGESKDAMPGKPGKPMSSGATNQVNMVGAGAVFEGTFRTEGDVSISGRIVGELEVGGRAVVTQEGVVDGDLKAAHGDISGTVKGHLIIEERLMLRSTARVEGNVRTGRLIVEEGAVFDGECRMGTDGRIVTKTDGPREAALPRRAESAPVSKSTPPGDGPAVAKA